MPAVARASATKPRSSSPKPLASASAATPATSAASARRATLAPRASSARKAAPRTATPRASQTRVASPGAAGRVARATTGSRVGNLHVLQRRLLRERLHGRHVPRGHHRDRVLRRPLQRRRVRRVRRRKVLGRGRRPVHELRRGHVFERGRQRVRRLRARKILRKWCLGLRAVSRTHLCRGQRKQLVHSLPVLGTTSGALARPNNPSAPRAATPGPAPSECEKCPAGSYAVQQRPVELLAGRRREVRRRRRRLRARLVPGGPVLGQRRERVREMRRGRVQRGQG